ncbi:MAG: S-layer homology domain-containing protein [Candidatus Margulisbacteria bacterium]|nr:S-layer homology domain-containing protein [Candidatus Margulisiibacteriota bacterium]MBU1021446.1 S-layer homology domain-containing protein [Candidatus Margulisiibacteriota bacterium]MBU1728367.1 S-layer homology domain-containing protein [Candidatus Margulisiibacteriota bacterium]MBU1955890.1 S-layer homology domain-containing protein [Candidatus Margulisiibacteriota bacterium]
MKKIFFGFFLFLLVFNSAALASSIVDITKIGVGARPLGLAKAQTALVSDTSSIFINPAGLSELDRFTLLTMNSKLMQDVDYLTLAFSTPAWGGTVGFAFVSAGVSSIPLSTVSAGGTPEATGDFSSFGSQVFVLSYGIDYGEISSNDFLKRMELGASLKYFMQNFSGVSSSLSGANGTGMDMDLGIKYYLSDWAKMGLTIQNVLPSSLGGTFTWAGSGLSEGISSVINTGIGFKLWGEDAPFQVQAQELFIEFDTEMYYYEKKQSLWHVGMEWWPVEILALRIGVDQQEDQVGGAYGVRNNLTTGVGLNYAGFTFDYAYHQFGGVEENASYFFSIGYLGEDQVEIVERTLKKKGRRPIIFTEVLPAPAVKTFTDVPNNYWARPPIEYLATLKIFDGFPDGTFKPNDPINRAEIAVLLVNAKELPLVRPTASMFSDVPPGHWAERQIKAAVDRGYISGYPSGKFEPYRQITRAEGVIILSKFAGLIIPKKVPEKPFPDIGRNHWAAKEIYAAKVGGLLEYLGGKNFEPDKKLTRAEVAEIISKTRFGKEKIKEFLMYKKES